MKNLLDGPWSMFRDTIRSIGLSFGVIAVAVLMLAGAAGASAAMWGLVSRGLFASPALVASPEQVFTLGFQWGDDRGRPSVMTTTSFPKFMTIRQGIAASGEAAAFQRTSSALLLSRVQREAEAVMVSGSYFDLLGVPPVLGRALDPADDRTGSPAIVLSHAFWRSAFGGNSEVLGQRVSLAGVEYTVAGVMPRGFNGHSTERVDVWVPLAAAMQSTPGWDRDAFRNVVSVVVRVNDSMSTPAVRDGASAALGTTVLLQPVGAGADVSPVDRQIAIGLTALSILMVVLALANTATLLLVRGARRRRELAIRAALGATRRRLLAQIVAESILIATVAGVLAVVAAVWFQEGVGRLLLPDLAADQGLTGSTLMTACAAALIAGLTAAVSGAAQLPGADGAGTLSGGPRVAGGRRIAERALLVLQVGVSVLLLAGFGMFARSLYNLGAQEFGFRMDDVLMVDFPPGPGDLQGRSRVLTDAVDRVAAVPGVARATVIQAAPFASHHIPPISVPGLAEPPSADGQLPFLTAATTEFFEIMGVQMLAGRAFTPQDDRGAPVVIVNESMARGAWPGENAVGKCIRIGFDPDFDPSTASGPPVPSVRLACREVVGVARDLRQRSVVPTGHEGRLMQYFVPFSQVPPPPTGFGGGSPVQGLLVRTIGDRRGVASAVRNAVVNGRADLPYLRVRAYREILGAQMQPWERGTTLLAVFATLALLVAAVGLYAVFAHAVADRRHEMAIRLAVGAGSGRVLRMVLGDAMKLATIGVIGGTAGAALAGRSVASLLYGTSPADPVVLASAAAVMFVVAATATWIPAVTASRANPNELLR